MANTENFYQGRGYGFDKAYNISETYGDTFLNIDYRFPSSQFGFPTDPRTANQLDAVSKKLSTGAKTIEVSGIQMETLDAIPKQFFKEINRLKKLTGVDLTFHGPLLEPTGFQGRQGWKEGDRLHSERQMISAVRRSHDLDPKGNMVVTFHSSNGLPEPETKIIDEKGNEVLKDFWVVDDYEGKFGNIPQKISHFKGEIEVKDTKTLIEKENKDNWFGLLESINFHIRRGAKEIEQITKLPQGKALLELHKNLGTPEGQKLLKELGKDFSKEFIDEHIHAITFGELDLRQAYQQFQTIYDRAYTAAERDKSKEDLSKLDQFREEIKSKFDKLEDPANSDLLAEELQNGIHVLRSINTPRILMPLREWAVDKASATFANVAFDSYKKFKNTAPIISIENPPVGMGLARAEDLREIVESARKKFAKEAQEKLNLSESEARKQAEKLIGVTWDVGHINMLRGHGYEEKHIVGQTKEIAPYVKHVHLSDNFGMAHTELPMGMGNVPTKKMLELINKYNKQVKKIAETGNWFEPFRFTPVKQTLSAFGSPVYGANGPYWNQIADTSTGYFAGQGAINPDIHHSLFGSGFSNLPVELGGQMAGRSRVSGAPIE